MLIKKCMFFIQMRHPKKGINAHKNWETHRYNKQKQNKHTLLDTIVQLCVVFDVTQMLY